MAANFDVCQKKLSNADQLFIYCAASRCSLPIFFKTNTSKLFWLNTRSCVNGCANLINIGTWWSPTQVFITFPLRFHTSVISQGVLTSNTWRYVSEQILSFVESSFNKRMAMKTRYFFFCCNVCYAFNELLLI